MRPTSVSRSTPDPALGVDLDLGDDRRDGARPKGGSRRYEGTGALLPVSWLVDKMSSSAMPGWRKRRV